MKPAAKYPPEPNKLYYMWLAAEATAPSNSFSETWEVQISNNVSGWMAIVWEWSSGRELERDM